MRSARRACRALARIVRHKRLASGRAWLGKGGLARSKIAARCAGIAAGCAVAATACVATETTACTFTESAIAAVTVGIVAARCCKRATFRRSLHALAIIETTTPIAARCAGVTTIAWRP